MIKAILFDMDGVLIDSHDVWFERFNDTREYYGHKRVTMDDFNKNIWGINFSETAGTYFPGRDIEVIRKHYMKTFENYAPKIKLMNNLIPILKYIQSMNLKIAVVSNTQSDIIRLILKRLEVLDYFDLIVGGERVKYGKPDPEIVLIACKELKTKPKEAILVGDTEYDKRAAEKAGCCFIGYKFNKGIDDLIELKEMIKC